MHNFSKMRARRSLGQLNVSFVIREGVALK